MPGADQRPTNPEPQEHLDTQEIVLSPDVYNALEQRTRNQIGSQEFAVLLLGRNGIATELMDIGIASTNSSVKIEGLESSIVGKLTKLQSEYPGLEIIAAYHNHPPDHVTNYQKDGRFPESYSLCPSPGDLRAAVMSHKIIAQGVGQSDYPQLIGGFLSSGFSINGFRVNRAPTGKEEDSIYDDSLEIPGSSVSEGNYNGRPIFQISYYLNPAQRLKEYFTFVPSFVGNTMFATELPNPLAISLGVATF